LERYPRNRIINIDETDWRTVATGFLAGPATGAESATCHIEDDEKAGIPVMAAMTAGGGKLPLTVLGKGTTPGCLVGLELSESVNGDFTKSGWTMTDVMCRYFQSLRTNRFCDQQPLIVILDTYVAHRAHLVRSMARQCNITLVFIPPGCTDRLQPLDRRVFGVLKAYAHGI
jgi:hypothetical protein